MRFGDPLNDRKAEAEAALGARSGFVGSEEALENVRGGGGWNADPGVGDAQADTGRSLTVERQVAAQFCFHRAARRGVTNGVIEEIDYEPAQELLVAGEGEIGFGVAFERD